MEQRVRLAAPPDRHHQRVHDQGCIAIRLHGPADDAPGEQVQHDGDIEPAFRGPDIREIGQPLAVRPLRLEVPVEDVVGDHRPVAVVLRLSAPFRPGFEGVQPHQPLDPVEPASQSILEDVAPDAGRAP